MVELIGDAAGGGDLAWVRLSVARGTVLEVDGEGPGVGELAGELRGRSLLEAAAVPGGRLATDALANALGPAVRAPFDPHRVAVAMSGGVDSAVTLLEVKRSGLDPVGVTLRLWLDPDGPDAERACCSPEAVLQARELCHDLGLPHVTLDLRERFRDAVVRPFVDGYRRGDTPNPCVRCNGVFRFASLLAFARRIGASRLATGHYARIVEAHGRLLVARGVDPAKDQSYMLGRLDPAVLDRVWFPLGAQTKEATRAAALAAGLAAAGRGESQEACFLAGDDYRAFLGRQGVADRPGPVLDQRGEVVGRHEGTWRVTPGQRRGLGLVSGPEPLYAVRRDRRRNAIVVGPRAALARTSVRIRSGRLYAPVGRIEAKLRYRSEAIAGRVTPRASGFRIDLDQPFYGVATGQVAVLYDGDAVVGAGLIAGSSR